MADSDIYDNGKVGIGTTSPQGLFSVSGGEAGQALVGLNNTAIDQNILVGSASGTTRFVFDYQEGISQQGIARTRFRSRAHGVAVPAGRSGSALGSHG